MPIQILWGNDLNAQNTFIQKLIDKEVSKEWKEINVTNLNGDDDEQVNKAFDAVLTPPFGDGYRIVTLKNNPIFTAKNEDLRTKAEQILAAGEVSEFQRPEFKVMDKLFEGLSLERTKEIAGLNGDPKLIQDDAWRLTTAKSVYDQAGDYFKKRYQYYYNQSGDRDSALQKAQKDTTDAMGNGDFDNVLSDIIEDTKIAKAQKLVQLYRDSNGTAINSATLLEGEEDPVLNAIDYFSGNADKLDHTWTLLARGFPNKGPLKLAHDRLVKLNRIKPIPALMLSLIHI